MSRKDEHGVNERTRSLLADEGEQVVDFGQASERGIARTYSFDPPSIRPVRSAARSAARFEMGLGLGLLVNQSLGWCRRLNDAVGQSPAIPDAGERADFLAYRRVAQRRFITAGFLAPLSTYT